MMEGSKSLVCLALLIVGLCGKPGGRMSGPAVAGRGRGRDNRVLRQEDAEAIVNYLQYLFCRTHSRTKLSFCSLPYLPS